MLARQPTQANSSNFTDRNEITEFQENTLITYRLKLKSKNFHLNFLIVSIEFFDLSVKFRKFGVQNKHSLGFTGAIAPVY